MKLRPPADAVLIEQPDRCRAMVKYVWHWRCKRPAGAHGLCTQHAKFGATVPSAWQHWRNERGVICCEPVAPFHKECP